MKKVVIALLLASSLSLASCDLILFSSMDDLAPEAPVNVATMFDFYGEGEALVWTPVPEASGYTVYVVDNYLSDATKKVWKPLDEVPNPVFPLNKDVLSSYDYDPKADPDTYDGWIILGVQAWNGFGRSAISEYAYYIGMPVF